MNQPASLDHIQTLDQLADALGKTSIAEAELRGISEADVISERLKWLEGKRSAGWFLRKWRALNSISPAAFGRLTGCQLAPIRRAIRMGDLPCVFEPITGKVRLWIGAALLRGFSYSEIERARKGEDVRFIKSLLEAADFSVQQA